MIPRRSKGSWRSIPRASLRGWRGSSSIFSNARLEWGLRRHRRPVNRPHSDSRQRPASHLRRADPLCSGSRPQRASRLSSVNRLRLAHPLCSGSHQPRGSPRRSDSRRRQGSLRYSGNHPLPGNRRHLGNHPLPGNRRHLGNRRCRLIRPHRAMRPLAICRFSISTGANRHPCRRLWGPLSNPACSRHWGRHSNRACSNPDCSSLVYNSRPCRRCRLVVSRNRGNRGRPIRSIRPGRKPMGAARFSAVTTRFSLKERRSSTGPRAVRRSPSAAGRSRPALPTTWRPVRTFRSMSTRAIPMHASSSTVAGAGIAARGPVSMRS